MGPTFAWERECTEKGFKHIVGIDEVGRGCLAGPLVVAGVILPLDLVIPKLNDSKLLSAKVREHIAVEVKLHALAYHIVCIEPQVIDEINIWQAWIKAIQRMVDEFPVKPDVVLLDGNPVKGISVPVQAIVKGDAKVASISAASVIAKVFRDDLMKTYHTQYPLYGFDQHKGYGTALHRSRVIQYGPCAIHRKSFEPIKSL